MTGAEVKEQVMEALAIPPRRKAGVPRMNAAYAALEPCVVLTAEEAGWLREHGTYPPGWGALLTPQKVPL